MSINVITEDRASGAQVIDGSLKFDSGSSNTLRRTPGSAGNRNTWTLSTWIKRDTISSTQHPLLGGGNGTGHGLLVRFSPSAAATDTLQIGDYTSSWQWQLITSRVFRDTGWYHIVIAVDTTLSTNSDRVKLYINGTRETSFGTASYPSEDYNTYWNTNTLQVLGGQTWNGAVNAHYNGRLSNAYFVDGLSLGPGYFGFTDPLTGTWRPKKFRADGTTVNNGTQWSATTGNFTTAAQVFNGSLSNRGYANSTGLHTITTGKFQIKNNLRLYNNFRSDGTYHLIINGVSINVPGTGTDSNAYRWSTIDISSLQLPITVTSLKYRISQVQGISISAIEVDGVFMVDSTTTNLDFGTNGFYLPMDGNSPIGKDQSGENHDWTPTGFGGSNTLDKATGALPILNTTQGGAATGVGVRTDAYANDLVFAVPLVGNDQDLSNKINSSTTKKTITNTGATATSTVSNFYGESFDFDGSNDDLTWSITGGLGSGDFTIEYWVYQDTLSDYQTHLSSTRGSTGFNVGTDASGDFVWYSSSARQIEVIGAITTGRWYHWAFVRSGSTITGYLDGVEKASFSSSTDFSASAFSLGALDSGGEYTNGKFSDVRIYVGTAKYTSNFIPASRSPDILPNTPSGVSGGSKLTKITEGSHGNSKDGLRNFGNISVADSADLEFGSGNFTMEAFIYIDGTPGTGSDTYTICSKWQNRSAPTDKGYIWRVAGSNLEFYWTTDGSSNNSVTGTAGKLGENRWYHVAIVRNGTTGTFYIDGEADSTTISFGSDTIRDTGNPFRIGSNTGSPGGNIDQEFNGLISNVRVLKGTALYTSNFTPPSKPLTNITNTKILACQDPDYSVVGYTTTTATGASPIFKTTGDYGETYGDGNLNADSNASDLVLCLDFYANATDRMPSGRPSNQKSLSAGGDPDPGNTTTSHFYGKSAYFDGNDQYSISSSADFSFDGEFCVELWIYATLWGPFFVSGGTNGIWLGTTNNGLVLRRYGVQNDIIVQQPPYEEWVHLAFTRDGSDVERLFINGEEQAQSVVDFTYTQNTLYIGGDGAGSYFKGYIQDLRVYKGAAKYTSDFNPPFRSLNRVRAAVSPSQFRHNRLAGGPVAFNPFNTDIDAVRGQETVYATWNPVSNKTVAVSNNNLTLGPDTSSGDARINATISVSSGKWYYECYVIASGSNFISYGVSVGPEITNKFPGRDTKSWSFEFGQGQGKHNNTYSTGYSAIAAGDTFMCAFDLDSKKMWFGKNGVWQIGNPAEGINAFYDISDSDYDDYRPVGRPYGSGSLVTTNFGQTPFKFTPPDGFQPLSVSSTRSETVIPRSDQYIQANIWSGDNNTRRFDIGMKPDFIWIKCRSAAAGHRLFDSVRGSQNSLLTSSQSGNDATSQFGYVSSFNDDGFTLAPGTYTNYESGDVNMSGRTYVGWAWKAGGDKGTFNVDDVGYASASAAGLSCTADLVGASVGTKQGFSIIRYQATNGETVAHGLSEAPAFMMIKNLDATGDWFGYHKNGNDGSDMSSSNGLNLNNNDKTFSSGSNTFITATSATTFTVGSSSIVQNGNDDFIAYIWHNVPGVQQFGVYQGNGDADGPFVETGFRPVIVWYKDITSGGYWNIRDSARTTYNGTAQELYTATSEVENHHNNRDVDFLSNGFKIRNSHNAINNSSRKYIYMTWAEAPTIGLYGAQSNAR